MSNSNLWLDEIIEILTKLGGTGTLNQIQTEIVERNNIDLDRYQHGQSIAARIRKTIYHHSSECGIYKGEQDLFYAVNGKGNGGWGLSDYDNDYDLIEGEESFSEGRQVLKVHLSYERNSKVIKLAKERFKQQHDGRPFCEFCGFDFYKRYGDLGQNFIEGHHTVPVSELKGCATTKVEDIVMVCSNCHRMLHRKRPWLGKENLQLLLNR
ncbi:restriction endonuclease [Bacillus toyonensis]|uniref:HNH endonuclease n=1 Tax=Bacillus toyonensis TaxID=155322 RepID=UPI000BF43E45|nr:HNH endonuclease [Bacillus toyonensis]PGC47384.1 restriction endonuclease [Bacillus toyonensis]